jgi:hypothetical protein
MDEQAVPIREVTPVAKRADECPNGCKDKFGRPRAMRRVVNQSPRVKRLEGGGTKQVTVMVTKQICDACCGQVTTEQEL